MARPTSLTPQVQERIVEAILSGNTYKAAAEYAGIWYTTFRDWMVRGEKGDAPYDEFYEAVKRAVNDWQMHNVKIIGDAAEKQWQAGAWLLERRFPEEWGRRDRIDVTIVLEDEAKRLAEELGIPVEEALAEARALMIEGPR